MSRVLVALDVPTGDEALSIANRLRPHVLGFKVGLELLMAEGPPIVSRVVELGAPVFVDAKLHDIPNTVAGAALELGALGARWVTVHASGGEEMMRVAADALGEGSGGGAGVLAVTVLTSLGETDLRQMGVNRTVGEQVSSLSRLASGAGAEGVVCAVPECALVKSLGLGLSLVTPGIRPASSDPGDQKRVATPTAAVEAGADLLVIGRPITAAEDMVSAAVAIGDEVAAAVSAA